LKYKYFGTVSILSKYLKYLIKYFQRSKFLAVWGIPCGHPSICTQAFLAEKFKTSYYFLLNIFPFYGNSLEVISLEGNSLEALRFWYPY